MTIVLTLFIWVGFAVLAAIVAANKNRSVPLWGLIGLLFSVFGFLAALVVSEVEEDGETSKSRKTHSPSTREFDPDKHEKKCPMCAEYIKLEARRCKHCGHEFSEEEVEEKIEEVKQKIAENRPSEPKEKKDPSELETPPPDEIAARCGDCHYPLRSGQKRCPKCQKEVVWS